MARRATGWTLFSKRGSWYVHFTFRARRYRIALGTSDRALAEPRAAETFAQVVSGRFAATSTRAKPLALDGLLSAWIAAVGPTYDVETVASMRGYARKFVRAFGRLDRITTASIGQYQRARLLQVTRLTLRKERSALKMFLRWLVEEGALAEIPPFPDITSRTLGTRSGTQRLEPVAIDTKQARAILAALPEWTHRKINGRLWPIRARYILAWETTLRPGTLAKLSVPEHWKPGSDELVIDAAHDKTGYGRSVPLTPRAVAALESCAPESGLIFGRRDFRDTLKRVASSVLGPELGAQFASYDFRHGAATELMARSDDLLGVGYMLGHRNLTSTQRYVHASKEAARRVLSVTIPSPPRKASPKTAHKHRAKEGT